MVFAIYWHESADPKGGMWEEVQDGEHMYTVLYLCTHSACNFSPPPENSYTLSTSSSNKDSPAKSTGNFQLLLIQGSHTNLFITLILYFAFLFSLQSPISSLYLVFITDWVLSICLQRGKGKRGAEKRQERKREAV